MESNYDNDDEMDFGSMPNFVPKNAPERKPDAPGEGKDLSVSADDPVRHEVLADGTRVDTWYVGDKIHRDGAPAVVKTFPDGSIEEQWYQLGMRHREDGPAVTHADGTKEWWVSGTLRENPEAVQAVDTPDVPVVPVVAAPGTAQIPDERVPQELVAAKQEEGAQDAVSVDDLADNPDMMKALMAVAAQEMAKRPKAPDSAAQAALNPEAVLAQPSSSAVTSTQAPGVGQGAGAAQAGLRNLADGGLGLVGGLAALAGAVGRGIGGAAKGLASDFEAKRQAGGLEADAPGPRTAPGISVLPRISEYRVDQAEKMASAYENAQQEFWASGKLPDVRRAIEERARETGASVPDIMAKMVPGGELEDLRSQFIEAVGESPEAQDSKKAMDKALDSFLRQYGRGSEELLNVETGQNPDYEGMRDRFEGTREKMEELVGQSPVFAGEEKSHAERFREAVERIAKRIQEMLERVAQFIRGRSAAAEQREEVDYEP